MRWLVEDVFAERVSVMPSLTSGTVFVTVRVDEEPETLSRSVPVTDGSGVEVVSSPG